MNRLKELRRSKGLSIEELSKELKSRGVSISASAISQYERKERKPKIETWKKLADYFCVPVDYFRGIEVRNANSRLIELEKENMELRGQLTVYKRELGMIVMSVPNVDEMILDFEEENHIKNGYGASWKDKD